MIELLGNLSLAVAVLVAILAGLLAVASIKLEIPKLLGAARVTLGLFAALMTTASIALFAALINNDFRIQYVAHYTERALPIGYKLAAFWAGQEGSLLLWAWMIAVLTVVFAFRRRQDSGLQAAATITTLAAVCTFFAALMLIAANPFALSAQVPVDGHGLNPMLQDPGMIAHPPLLFLGYSGFTIPFAMFVGAMIAGTRDNNWVAGIRRWSIFSWLMLTIGILLGAQWAYVELGWGGYWAWDPVENASLLPWLTATALIHSIMIQQHRGIGKLWNAVLIAMTFVLCIFGTYLTRSGVIQSVHSFGESLVGTFFLAFLAIVIVFSVILIIARLGLLRADHTIDGLLGREAMFLATNVLLVLMTAVVLIGTIFPIISRTFLHQEITVGVNFYNKVVGPLAFALVTMMALGPSLSYGHEAAKRLVRGMIVPSIAGAVITAAFWGRGLRNGWALACVAIATVLLANVLYSFIQSLIDRMHSGDSLVAAIVHLLDGNHRRYGGQIVHIGMILIVAGVTATSLFQNKRDLELHPGDNVQLAGQTLHFARLNEVRFANYTAVVAEMTLTDSNGNVTKFEPQRRFYDKSEEPNTEVSLKSGLKQDYYLTLAGWETNGQTVAIQAIVNPLVSWIWIGGMVMSAGAILCLLPRIVPQQVEMFETVQQSSKTQSKATRGGAEREFQHA